MKKKTQLILDKLTSLYKGSFTHKFIYKKGHRILSRVRSTLILFWAYVRSTTYDEYLQARVSRSKTLLETFIEWTVDVIGTYLLIGTMLSVVLSYGLKVKYTFMLFIASTFAWWLLERLLRKIKERQ